MAALAKSEDLTDPLKVAALWWLAVLKPDQYEQQLKWLTHAPEAWGDFEWATDLLSDKSIASKVYYAVDNRTDVAVVRFVPEVAETAQTFASFVVPGNGLPDAAPKRGRHLARLGPWPAHDLCS